MKLGGQKVRIMHGVVHFCRNDRINLQYITYIYIVEWRTDDFQYNASRIDVPVDATLYHLPYMLLLTKLLLGMLQSLTQFVSSTKKHFPLFFPFFLYIYVCIYIYIE